MNAYITELNSNNFDDFIAGKLPALVDFWAEWCGPCRMIGPVIDEVASELQGQIAVGKVNVDHNGEISAKYGIRGIPTLMIFKEGKIAATKVGGLNKTQLLEFIRQHM